MIFTVIFENIYLQKFPAIWQKVLKEIAMCVHAVLLDYRVYILNKSKYSTD